MSRLARCALPVASILLAVTARAGVVEYTDRAAWEAATSNTATIDWTAPSPGSYYTAPNFDVSTSLGTVSFSNPINVFYIQSPSYQANLTRPLPDPLVSLGTNPGYNITINLPSGTTAFGMELYASSEASGTVADGVGIEFLNTTHTSDGVAVPYTLFRGFVSTDEIRTVIVKPVSGNACVEIQRFSFGDASVVPLPVSASSGLALLGVLGIGLGVRRMKVGT